MINHETLREKIRTIYFGLISEVSIYTYEDLLSKATKELNLIVNTTYIDLYLYNNTQNRYVKFGKKQDDITPPHLLMKIDQILEQHNQTLSKTNGGILHSTFEEYKINGIHIHSKYEPFNFMLVLVGDEALLESELSLIKDETERFFNLVNYYEASKANDKMNEILFSLSSSLYSSTDKNVVLTNIIESLNDIYRGFSHYLLLSHDFETDHSLPIKSIEYSDDKEKQISSKAFITGKVQIEQRSNPDHTRLYAPLLGSQGVYGLIQMIAPRQMDFTHSELEFIAQVSKTAGNALENSILYESSVDRASNLKLINNATHRLNSYLSLADIVRILKNEIVAICEPSEIGLIYFSEKSERGYTIFSESTSFFSLEEGQQFVDVMYKQIIEKTEAIFSSDYSINYPNFNYRSVITIPMIESGQTYGFITVLHEEKTYFTFENFKLVQSLIHHATLALVNAVLREKLEKAVITDYLTGLYSRKYLDKMFNKHMKKDKQGTLILFDIDDFKKINDEYGHSVGDEVIIAVAAIIKNSISSQDIAARWGGEEFAIYLPHVGLIKGVQVAEEIRKKVAENTKPSVTFSCGVSTWNDKNTDNVNDVFIRADRALYEAKEIGKNRVIIDDQLNGFVKQS